MPPPASLATEPLLLPRDLPPPPVDGGLQEDTALPALHDDSSLSSIPFVFSTSALTRLMVCLACLLAHACFVYGQTQIMWYLYFTIQLDATLEAKTVASKMAFAALQIPNPVDVALNLNQTIEAFTYWDAIHGLWVGHNNPAVQNTDPGIWGKVSAAVLIVFSGIWPHVKLLSLQYQYHRSCRAGEEVSRTTALYWLDTFGKWCVRVRGSSDPTSTTTPAQVLGGRVCDLHFAGGAQP
jgi:hypothetical protein